MKRFYFYLLVGLLLIPYILFALYSYTQVDPNLVLSTNPTYWNVQQQLWQIGYHQRDLSTQLYIGIVIAMFVSFAVALKIARTRSQTVFFTMFGIAGLLALSYNALSHDVFNYMFNAKMLVQYGADPHVHVALEFAGDEWVRFMNNTHTAAPYGYGWTILSLLPYLAGLGKFTLTLLSFKAFAVGAFALLCIVQHKIANVRKDASFGVRRWLFFLNPLVLVELIGNVHNDTWMMLPYFLALFFGMLAVQSQRGKKLVLIAMSLAAFAISASIKFATVALLPVYGLSLFVQRLPKKGQTFFHRYWADISALCMLAPLLTARSQQFHPWYLVWSLSFLPFVRSVKLRLFLLGLSFSSMLRYIPYLASGGYTPETAMIERQITWLGGVVCFLLLFIATRLMKRPSMLE